MPEEYYECELANRLQVPMRLTGRGQRWPLYSYPRLARYAFFTGTGLAELDFPASHGQQFLKYARRHNLSHRTLELAFGSTEAIYEFRRTACPALPATAVKSACNLLAYGSGLADWRKAHRMAGIPPALQALKDELTTARTHMASHAPPIVEGCCQGSEAPRADAGEFDVPCRPRRPGAHDSGRDDPRLAGRQHPRLPLPLVGSRLRPGPRRRHLRHPEDVSGRLGGVPGRDPRLRRASRRDAHDRSAEAEERRTGLRKMRTAKGRCPPTPHLDFAVCVEGELPCQYNYASKELEFFNANAGVWMHPAGRRTAAASS